MVCTELVRVKNDFYHLENYKSHCELNIINWPVIVIVYVNLQKDEEYYDLPGLMCISEHYKSHNSHFKIRAAVP